jgi:hypothetical protein
MTLRLAVIVAVVLLAASTIATIIFIGKEQQTEGRVEVVREIGSPCRSAKTKALEHRDANESYWDAIARGILSDRECGEQSFLVALRLCLHYALVGSSPLCRVLVPGPLQPDRSQGDGDRKGGGIGHRGNNPGGQPGGIATPGTQSGGAGQVQIPPIPPTPQPPEPPVDSVQDAIDEAQEMIENALGIPGIRPR